MTKKMILTALLAVTTFSANAKPKEEAKQDTLVVSTTPKMHCENCENKIKKNIRFVKGTKKIETSVPNQSVTIVYDPTKANLEEYKKAFKKIGFEIKKK